jgi:hypothetical protein
MDDGFVGRNIFEDGLLYVDVPQSHRETLLTKFRGEISEEEVELIEELNEVSEKKARPLLDSTDRS